MSMATPLIEQVNNVELVDTATSSTSDDESCSSSSNVEHSGSREDGGLKGEVISQRFVVKQLESDNDDCHRTPLTVSCCSFVSFTVSNLVIH